MEWETVSLGMFFFENESETFRGYSQGVDISLSHCRWFFFYQMNVEVLTCTSRFVPCLIPSGSLTLLQGLKVSCEAAPPISPCASYGSLSMGPCALCLWLQGQVLPHLHIYLAAVIRVWEERAPEQHPIFLSSNVNTLETKQGKCFGNCHLFAFSTWPLSE